MSQLAPTQPRASPAPQAPTAAVVRSIEVLEAVLGPQGVPGLAVRLWDGTSWPDADPRAATLVLARPSSLREMFLPGSEAGLAESYLRGAFDVEGDMEAALETAWPAADNLRGWRRRLGVAARLVRLPRPTERPSAHPRARLRGRLHTSQRDRAAVAYHYNVSNEFFRLFLGPSMVYSCAYFERANASLEEAQQAKLDLVCRKLRLRPGMRFLDIGCGWGSLVIHAASRYGVQAVGITLSERQADLAQRRIKEAGLEGRAHVRLLDYRDLPASEPFDAIASVGMVEHVGAAKLPAYFASALRVLKPGGSFLNHGIAAVGVRTAPRRDSFIARHVFPDGELVPIETTIAAAAGAGFEARDVESLREHYAWTLRHWIKDLEGARVEALRHVDEATYRVWRLYMAGSATSFAHGRVNVYQTLLRRPNRDAARALPTTRRDWYV